jgi:hypothetical protein
VKNKKHTVTLVDGLNSGVEVACDGGDRDWVLVRGIANGSLGGVLRGVRGGGFERWGSLVGRVGGNRLVLCDIATHESEGRRQEGAVRKSNRPQYSVRTVKGRTKTTKTTKNYENHEKPLKPRKTTKNH